MREQKEGHKGSGYKIAAVFAIIFAIGIKLFAIGVVLIGFPLLMGYIAHDFVTSGGPQTIDDYTYATDFEYEMLKSALKEKSIYFKDGFYEEMGFGAPNETMILYGIDAEDYIDCLKEGDCSGDVPTAEPLYGYRFVISKSNYVLDWRDDIRVELGITVNNRIEQHDNSNYTASQEYKNFVYEENKTHQDSYCIKGCEGILIHVGFDIYVPKKYYVADDNIETEIKEQIIGILIKQLIDNIEYYDEEGLSGDVQRDTFGNKENLYSGEQIFA